MTESLEERLRDLGVSSLKRNLRGDLINARRESKEDRTMFFPVASCDRARETGGSR